MNKREIKGKLFGKDIINEEWQCSHCEEWSNSVEWSIVIEPKSFYDTERIVKYTCPKCLSTETT